MLKKLLPLLFVPLLMGCQATLTNLTPQTRTRNAVGETIRDLTSHPWAGARVKMTLVAKDEASTYRAGRRGCG